MVLAKFDEPRWNIYEVCKNITAPTQHLFMNYDGVRVKKKKEYVTLLSAINISKSERTGT